ncbi:MAG: two-component regulator propeller domain-containing protein, partial [Bacteroidota bacterium]|nr:two-component regulator propeller domain-containing protein [Bacteroidota bacterium]
MFERGILHLIPLLIISFHSLSAQQAPVTLQDVGKLEDYSNPQCFALYQDSTGLLWMSNWSGIDRWDGNRMVNYPYNPFDSLGWPSRYVGRWITRDDQNNLWCMGSGLVRFDLEKERFQKIHLSYDSSELTIRYLKYDPEGYLWLVCKEGIFQYKHKEDFLKRIPLSGSNGQEKENYRPRMVNILRDTTGRVWMSDNHLGLFYYEAKEDVFIKQSLDLPALVDENMNMVRMKKDPQGNFWLFGNKAELAMFNPYTREFEWAGLPVYDKGAPSTEGGMAIDDQGRIWFGVDRGLMLYNPFTNTLTPMDTSYASKGIFDMISDQHGNILFGSYEGVKIIDSHDVSIRTIHLTEELSSEGTNWVTSVARDGQTLWMGTFKTGIIRYNLETDQFIRFRADNRPGGFDHPYVWKVLRDRTGRIWFTAGWTGSLYRVAPDNSSFEQFHPGSSHVITQCDEGFFWIIDPEGIVRFDPVTQDTLHIRFRKPLPIEYVRSHFDFIAFIRDKQGIFWFGQQDGGLYRIDPESRDWSHFTYKRNNPEGLPDQHVRSIHCDSRGTIWVSTWNGLSKIIPQTDKDMVLSFDNHFIHDPDLDHTLKITEDIQGNIYVGTLSGLMVIRPDGTIDKYTHKDNLPRDPSAIWMLEKDHENGAIYLGRSDIAIIPSGFLASEKSTAPILFTGFMIGGEKVNPGEDSPLKSSIMTADHINLRHDQNFFRIDFATPYFSHPERNRYRYFLAGIDPDTVYSGNQSYAEYTDLAPGKYTFWVTGAITRGPWNPEGRSIEIIIHPPWYRSNTAISGYFIAMLLLVFGYVRMRTEKLRREKNILETQVRERTAEIRQKNEKIVEMERLKTRFFTDLSHEIRTPLSLISGPL